MPLDAVVAKFEERMIDILDLDEALSALARDDPQLPKRTVERDWTFARIRLRRLIE